MWNTPEMCTNVIWSWCGQRNVARGEMHAPTLDIMTRPHFVSGGSDPSKRHVAPRDRGNKISDRRISQLKTPSEGLHRKPTARHASWRSWRAQPPSNDLTYVGSVSILNDVRYTNWNVCGPTTSAYIKLSSEDEVLGTFGVESICLASSMLTWALASRSNTSSALPASAR